MISAERTKSVLMALGDLLVLYRRRIQCDRTELRFMPMCAMWHDGLEHLFYAFVAEISAANHQERRDRRGKEVAEG
jgi:hypothetical protein